MAEDGLRIGIIREAGNLRHWQARCLQALSEVPGVRLVFLAESPAGQGSGRSSVLYRRWLRGRTAKMLSIAESPLSIAGTPRIATAAADELRRYRPDLVLQFPSTELPSGTVVPPRLGTWRFILGGRLPGTEEIPGLHEVLHALPIAMVSLQRKSDEHGTGAILRSGCFGVNGRSVDAIAETVLQSCADWPAQVCRALLAGDPEAAVGHMTGPMPPSVPAPTNTEMFQLWWNELGRDRRSRKASRTAFEEWNFGVLPHPIASLLDEKPNFNVRWLPSPGNGQGRSTPFGYVKDGKLSVLYEKYDANKDTRVIGRLRPKRDNNLKRSRVLLKAAGHLSYPFVLEHEGAVLVIPENTSGGQVDLYSLDEEQTALTHISTLLNEPLLSPTLFRHEGRWWLFGTRAPLEDTALYAYHSDRLEGPYTSHSHNPVKTDIRSARPGGTPFRQGNELWRPAQDHSDSPAGRIAMNRIIELTPGRFSEETVKFLDPGKGTWSHGMRTLSMIGELTLVDGMRYTSGKGGRKAGHKRDKTKNREHEQDESDGF